MRRGSIRRPSHKQNSAVFFPRFIRRLLEHTSLLDLAYRMKSTNESKRTTEESGEVVREGRRQWNISHDAHVAAVL